MSAELKIVTGITIIILLHLVAGYHEWRQSIVRKIGLNVYRVFFSLIMIASLWFLITAFSMRPFEIWWIVPVWTSYIPLSLMPLVIVLTLCHFLPNKNDTITRQPAGWATLIWSAAHLMANGESGTTLLFSGFFIYGILAIYLRERKADLGDQTARHGNQETPLMPFTHIPQSFIGKKLAFIFMLIVLTMFVLIYLHEGIIGLTAIPAIL